MLNLTLRRRLIDTARAMNRTGLNQGMAGNVSVRYRQGLLITPSALAYDRCRPGDLVYLDGEGRVAEGQRRPSSEWRIHRDIYRARPEAGAILHAHPPWATTLACLGRAIPPFHYMVAVAGGETIPCAGYAPFGSRQLSDNVLAALTPTYRACLMAHHGLVCLAADLESVLALAREIENLARMYTLTLQAGGGPLLSAAEMRLVRDRFAVYRNGSGQDGETLKSGANGLTK